MRRFTVVLGALLAAAACSSNKGQERQDPMPSSTPSGETAPAAPEQETQGTLMLQNDGSWAVQRDSGEPLPIAVTYETEFLGPDGSPVSATQFTEGREVRVTYESRGQGPALVRRVELMDQGQNGAMPPRMDPADPANPDPDPGAGMPDDDMNPSQPGTTTPRDPGSDIPRTPGTTPPMPGEGDMPADPQTDPMEPGTPMDDSRL